MQIDTNAIRRAIDLREAARFYGFDVNRAGFCCCPFHDEKTASCHIWPDHFYCFGCGAGGDAIAFVKRLFDLSFPAAVAKLNNDFQLGLPIDRPQTAREALAAQRAERERKRQQERREEAQRTYFNALDEYTRLDKLIIDAGDNLTDEAAEAMKRLPAASYRLTAAEMEVRQLDG
ncbi:MAG: hypothetical protein KBS74_01325 [Clostridiales bacterium]|nr:hypothetical protein [Candidatus Cacconaster stercorequi]